MSETVIETGKLILIGKFNNETLEEQCKRILNNSFGSISLGCYKTYEEALMNELYENYYVYKNNLYKLDYDRLDSHSDIIHGNIEEDGTVNFFVSYYNGGTCLYEMLDGVMDKVNNSLNY